MATRDPYPSGSATPGAGGGYSTTGAGMSGQQGTASATERAKDKAGETAERAKEKVGEAAEQAKEQARSRMGGQLTRAGDELDSVAKAVTQVGQQLRGQDQDGLAQYTDKAAGQINRLAGYLRNAEADDVMRDAQRFARQQPALFLGGAFVLGVLAARFLKSSAPDRPTRYGAADRYGYRASGYDYRSSYRPAGYGAGYRPPGYATGARAATPAGVGSASRGYGTSGGSFDRAMSGSRPSGTPGSGTAGSMPGQTPATRPAADPLTRPTPGTRSGASGVDTPAPSTGAPLGGSLGQPHTPTTNPSASGTESPGTPWARPTTGQPPARPDTDTSGSSTTHGEPSRERGDR
jgi:hypothetical protein